MAAQREQISVRQLARRRVSLAREADESQTGRFELTSASGPNAVLMPQDPAARNLVKRLRAGEYLTIGVEVGTSYAHGRVRVERWSVSGGMLVVTNPDVLALIQRRESYRAPLATPFRLLWVEQGELKEAAGTTVNVSIGGLAGRITAAPEPGAEVTILLDTGTVGDLPIVCVGKVLPAVPEAKIDVRIEITQILSADRDRVSRIVQKAAARRARLDQGATDGR